MIGHLYLLGGGLILLGTTIAVCLRMSARRVRAEVVAEQGPDQVRGSVYRSRQVRRG